MHTGDRTLACTVGPNGATYPYVRAAFVPLWVSVDYEAEVNLLWTPHNLAPVGALGAQMPTP